MNVALAALTTLLSPAVSQYCRGLENNGCRSAKLAVLTGAVVIVFSATTPSGSAPASLTAGAGEMTVAGRLLPAFWQPEMNATARASTADQ